VMNKVWPMLFNGNSTFAHRSPNTTYNHSDEVMDKGWPMLFKGRGSRSFEIDPGLSR